MIVLLYLRNCYHSTVLLSDDDMALSHTKVVLYSQYRNSGVFDAPTQNTIIYIIYYTSAMLSIFGRAGATPLVVAEKPVVTVDHREARSINCIQEGNTPVV